MGNIANILDARDTLDTFNMLRSLMNAVGLDYQLEGMRDLTLFAPPDSAFSALHHITPYDMRKDVKQLRRLLSFHIVPFKLTYAELRAVLLQSANEADGSKTIELETLSGDPISLRLADTLLVGTANVMQADVPADNGIIHIIDTILWPPELNEDTFA